MTPDEKTVERVAKAMAFDRRSPLDASEDDNDFWAHTGEQAKDGWRGTARAAISAMREDAAMDRLVAEGQRCDAMTPQDDRSLPGRIMVWHSSPTLNHLGTWATTRHPYDAVAYVPESLEAPTTVLDETSPRAAIGEIGNQMHNLACELQGNEDLAERLEHFACELWRAAQTASSEPMPAVTPQEAAKVLADNFDAVWTKAIAIEAENAREAASRSKHKWPVICREGVRSALRAISEDSQ